MYRKYKEVKTGKKTNLFYLSFEDSFLFFLVCLFFKKGLCQKHTYIAQQMTKYFPYFQQALKCPTSWYNSHRLRYGLRFSI